MKKFFLPPILSFTKHFIPILLIFLFGVLIRYPIYFNDDQYFTADEGVMANTILNILNGGPIVFYYDYARYFGLTGGFISLPFMWVLGFKTMAFNLPSTLFYSLYSWTMYLIARIIVPSKALMVLILMLISPPFITQMTTHNWPHMPAAFLGNLMFLLFIRIKLSDEYEGGKIFFLFFSMGIAIYTYTYSLIYILVIAILWAFSARSWSKLREKISYSALVRLFKIKGSGNKVVARFLDVLIVLFSLVIIFSYVFGGFGIDISGVSIFQVNNFHKPVFQWLVIILLRILVYRKDLVFLFLTIKSFVSKKISKEAKRIVLLSGSGFLSGLSPRIASILMGETSRGGQGFDIDLNIIKIIEHFLDIITRVLPILFSLEGTLQKLHITSFGNYENLLGILAMPLLLILLFSGISFCADHWGSIKRIFTSKHIKFNPEFIFILLPFLTFLANVIVQNGSQPRYLFPLFGTVVMWLGIFANKFKGFFIFVLVFWVGFYSLKTYKNYSDQGVIHGFKLVKLEKNEIYNLIKSLESKNIETAYSTYSVSQIGSFLSGGKLNISEFSNNPVAKAQKRRSLNDPNFAIIAQKKESNIYQNYLLKNKIKFKFEEMGEYKIYWEFFGEQVQINKLRSLISQ